MKKWIAAALIGALLSSFCAAAGEGVSGASVSAQRAALYDPLTGEFLYSKNGEEQAPMASTTKIMTALVILETLPLDQTYEIQPEWTGAEGSSMYLKAGEQLTVEDLLCGLMLMSGNDAALALACIAGGSEQGFVERMNEKAASLGLENTHFESASGLDGPEHYTTAQDLARLTAYAMENPEFCRIVGQKYANAGGRSMKNHNKLLFWSDEICGVKTGFTKKAGRCLVSAARRQGRLLIAVTLNGPDDWNDHQRLYQSAFSACQTQQTIPGGKLGWAMIFSGNRSQVELYCVGQSQGFLTEQEMEKLEYEVLGPRFVCAPVRAGEQYGVIQAKIGERVLFEEPVYYADSADALPEPPKSFWSRFFGR